jgi:hypothetical protein
MVTVFPGFGTPVTLTIFPSEVLISSTRLAVPSFSLEKPSILAIGEQPKVFKNEKGKKIKVNKKHSKI